MRIARKVNRFVQDCFDSTPRWVMALITIVTLGNIVGLVVVGIHTDEAFYWLWSERLDWGYYDHPPMIAWVIRLATSLFGDNGISIRLPALAAWATLLLVVFDLGKRMFPEQKTAPAMSVLVIAGAPLFQIGSHIITPDAPFILFSALSFYLFYRALVEDRALLWIAAGIAIGATALSKYNAILIPLSLLPVLVLTESGRKTWSRPGLWLAILFAAIVSAPVFVWNYNNDWISIAYQLGHGTGENSSRHGEFLGLYISGQLANVLPWMFLIMVASVIMLFKNLKTGNAVTYWFLSGSFVVPLLFFGVLGTMSKSEPNWPAMAFVPGSLLAGTLLSRWLFVSDTSFQIRRHWLKYFLIVSTVFSITLVNIVRYPDWAWWFEKQVIPNNTQIPNTYGWELLGKALRKNINDHFKDEACTVLSNNHLLAGQVALQLKTIDKISFVPGKRVTQFHLWERIGEIAPANTACLFVSVHSRLQNPSATMEYGQAQWILVDQVEVRAPDRSTRYYGIYKRN